MSQKTRMRIKIQGQVQGVGFRPFIWRLANELGLKGFCRNNSSGVQIEVQAEEEGIAEFKRRIMAELPELAKITSMVATPVPLLADEKGFQIYASSPDSGNGVLVSADVAICPDCLAEIRDPANGRFAYPFTNCTNCGPRYTITKSLPYDRQNTTMSCFELCKSCADEYANPADRRFHAQPVACAHCGPEIWLAQRNSPGVPARQAAKDVIAAAGQAILEGKILALRGLGGFQLVCDASNQKTVERLRKHKWRPHKALAIMAASTEAAEAIARIGDSEKALLSGRRKPIVLCPARSGTKLNQWICPDVAKIGIMLPYTPLHALLLDWLELRGCSCIVMTSGNKKDAPICLSNREALRSLDGIADLWLLHNRDILCRVDDSVVDLDGDAPIFLRRARGYTPEAIGLDLPAPPVLGCGAQLKAAFCLTRDSHAFLSQHIGNLEQAGCADFYEETYKHLSQLLNAEPELIVHDLHPDFFSTHFASRMAQELGKPAMPLQHHVAHAAACLGENRIYEPALALCLDGSGLGEDGTIWGGELLELDLAEPRWQRVGSLASFHLPGGERAIEQPWRIAAALSLQAGVGSQGEREERVRKLVHTEINSPLTSSAGRLFDAVSAMLGICEEITYEGQAAIRLETFASGFSGAPISRLPDFLVFEGEMSLLDSNRIFSYVHQDFLKNADRCRSAYLFHTILASGYAQMANERASQTGTRKVALTGGVLNNLLFRRLLIAKLQELGLEPLTHRHAPAGDGGVALGQAVWGRQLLMSGKQFD